MFNNGTFTHPQQWALPNGSQAQPSMPQTLNQHGVSMANGNPYSSMSGGGVMNGAGTFMAHGSNGNRNQLHNSGGGARVMPNRGPNGMGSMPAPALPPGSGSTSNFLQENMMLPPNQARRQEILNERTKAAHQRRQEQEERQKREQALTASGSLDLFAKPERVKHEDITAQQASQVLGSFSNAKRIINSQTSCIGIDYQPPTPAPAQQHIIGEEDEDENSDIRDVSGQSRSMPAPSSAASKVARRPPATIPPPPTGGHRLPPEQMNMTHRPSLTHKPYPRQQHPFGPNAHHHQHQQQQQQQQYQQQQLQQQQQQQQQNLASQSKRPQMQSHQSSPSLPSGMPMGQNPNRPGSNGSSISSNLNGSSMPAPASTSSGSFFGNWIKTIPPQLPKLQMPEDRDKASTSISEILQEVQTGVMPTPIQALFTPVVTKHEGNNARSEPRYFGVVSAPHFGNDEMGDDLMDDDLVSPLSPIKSSKLPFSSNTKPNNAQDSNTSVNKAKKVPGLPSSSNRNLNLSEDSDSDTDMPSEPRNKPVANNVPAAASPLVLQPAPPSKPPVAASVAPPTQVAPPVSTASSGPQNSQTNKDETSQKKTGGGGDSSSDSSDSDSSSDEDADDSKESSSDHDEVNPMDNDATFGLANILAKVKSTHSPGPNPHPSPKVTQTTPSAKPLIEDDMDIDGLLSQTIQPLPDINLGVDGSDLLGGLHPPLSPLPDDDDDDEDEDDDPLDRPLLSPLKKDPLPPPKGSSSSRRRSSSIRNSSSSYRELSDDDEDMDQQAHRAPPQRKHRKPKSASIRQPMLSPAVPVVQVPPPAPPSRSIKPSPKPSKGRPGSSKRRISLSSTTTPSVMLSSESEPEEAHPTSSSSAPLKPASIASESPRSVSSDKSASRKAVASSRPPRAPVGDPDESNSPVTNNTSKVKSRAMSRIFMSRSKSTTGTGGKGGKGGKGGITVERKTVPDAGDAANSSDGGEVKSYPAPIWRANGRPSILCQIPLNLLPVDTDFRVNLYNNHQHHRHSHPPYQPQPPHLQTPQPASSSNSSKRKRGRHQSGESVSSNTSSKHSFRSTTSSKSSSHKRTKQSYPSESAAPPKRVKLDETTTPSSTSCSSSLALATANTTTTSTTTSSAPKIDFPGPSSTNHIPSAKVEPMSNPSPSDAHSKPKATVAPTPNNNSGVSGSGGSNAPWPNKMMPPPSKVFFSYLEKNRDEEDEAEEDYNAYMLEAKKLKHAADREADRGRQAMIYLKAVLFFSLCGNYNEKTGDKVAGFTMYKETLNLIKHVCRPFRNSEFGTFDNKLAVLSLRCQSLLYLKLYQLRRHELKECQKIIGDHIQKATASQQNSPVGNNGNNGGNTANGVGGANAISPTPSPAGSEGSVCSKSSGYTSSGEVTNSSNGRYTGVLTPPTNPPPCLSVPQSVMQKQHQYCNYVSQCHELWEMADLYTQRGQCEDFIINLDRICGPLTLHSSLKDLVNYTRIGLDYLSKEPLNTSTS